MKAMAYTRDVSPLAGGRVAVTLGKRWLGTDHWDGDGSEPARTTAQRSGRCYELCAVAVGFSGPEGSILVHGTIRGPESDQERIGHSWVLLPDGTVWEPYMRDVYISEEEWTRFANAQVERKYGRGRVRRLMQETDHFGPWHETEGKTKK